jgi:hypothetical protein
MGQVLPPREKKPTFFVGNVERGKKRFDTRPAATYGSRDPPAARTRPAIPSTVPPAFGIVPVPPTGASP